MRTLLYALAALGFFIAAMSHSAAGSPSMLKPLQAMSCWLSAGGSATESSRTDEP